ncbi:MAG: extracellular solute-binding protein [Clostridia bacterium]|nr:extracellular solute-binding protein [Clostridia bacterium]
MIKKHINKAATALLLAASLVGTSAVFSGCGVLSLNKPAERDEDTTAVDETTSYYELDVIENDYTSEVDRYLKDLSGTDYGGAVVKIVTVANRLVVPDENTGTVLTRELEERNGAVEENLNVTIVSEEKDAETLLDELKIAVKAGDYYADAVMYPQDMMGAFALSGAISNMKSLPDFETDNGYYYPSAVAAGTGGDAVYGVAGPASLNADGLPCIYFNKSLIEKAGLESPYSLVDRGEWTIDKYTEYMRAVSGLEGEYYGYSAQNTSTYLTDIFFFGCGETLTASTHGSYPTLTLGSEKTQSVVDKIREATVNSSTTGDALTAIDAFCAGNVLFLVDRIDTMKTIANSSVDWGLLPVPKYDAEQTSYLSLAYYKDAIFFGAVPTAPNIALTSDLIAGMNIISYGYTVDVYVENASYYYLRDNDSIRMMRLAVNDPMFDFAYSYSNSYNAIPSATYMAVRNAVSEVSTLETYTNMWADQFSNTMYRLFNVGN